VNVSSVSQGLCFKKAFPCLCLSLYYLFKTAVSISDYVASNGMIIVEMEGMEKEAVIA
jgi:hypothetical protein